MSRLRAAVPHTGLNFLTMKAKQHPVILRHRKQISQYLQASVICLGQKFLKVALCHLFSFFLPAYFRKLNRLEFAWAFLLQGVEILLTLSDWRCQKVGLMHQVEVSPPRGAPDKCLSFHYFNTFGFDLGLSREWILFTPAEYYLGNSCHQ